MGQRSLEEVYKIPKKYDLEKNNQKNGTTLRVMEKSSLTTVIRLNN